MRPREGIIWGLSGHMRVPASHCLHGRSAHPTTFLVSTYPRASTTFEVCFVQHTEGYQAPVAGTLTPIRGNTHLLLLKELRQHRQVHSLSLTVL